jgi:hypothetical protein
MEQLLETVSGSGGDEVNDCALSQPETPEPVEGNAAFQVILVGACNEDQPAHPGHLTARCDEPPSDAADVTVAS